MKNLKQALVDLAYHDEDLKLMIGNGQTFVQHCRGSIIATRNEMPDDLEPEVPDNTQNSKQPWAGINPILYGGV